MPQWLAEGRPLEGRFKKAGAGRLQRRVSMPHPVDAEEVRCALESRSAQVCLSTGPSASVSGGDVAGAAPRGPCRQLEFLDYAQVVAEGHLRPAAAAVFCIEKAGVDLARPIITQLRLGVTADLGAGLEEIGKHAKSTTVLGQWGSRYDSLIAYRRCPPRPGGDARRRSCRDDAKYSGRAAQCRSLVLLACLLALGDCRPRAAPPTPRPKFNSSSICWRILRSPTRDHRECRKGRRHPAPAVQPPGGREGVRTLAPCPVLMSEWVAKPCQQLVAYSIALQAAARPSGCNLVQPFARWTAAVSKIEARRAPSFS